MKNLKAVVFFIFILYPAALSSGIKPDEDIVFYDTYMRYSEEYPGSVTLNIHGCVFEPEYDSPARNAFIISLSGLLEINGEPGRAIFDGRMRYFLADNERGKNVKITIGKEEYIAGRSGADGHFTGTFTLNAKQLEKNGSIDSNGILRYCAEYDGRKFIGQAKLAGRSGISVISDIDDTIKISNALDKKELLKNSFTRPYRKVPGMDKLYGKWAGGGFCFHYVSGSPWQLYRPLKEFLASSKFPAGSMHLKKFRIKDPDIIKFLSSDQVSYKTRVIGSIIRDFPGRKFILIGDSGEMDPEVYAGICGKFGKQVAAVFIRDVSNPDDTAERYAILKNKPGVIFKLFDDPGELQDFYFY